MTVQTPAERIRSLVLQLQVLGVDAGLLKQVSVHLLANYQSPDHWAELAIVFRRARNYQAADLVYKTALAMLADSAKLWNNYGVLLRDWGKLGEALDAVEHAVRLQANYAKAFATKGKILELLHRFADARKCYQTALDLDPRDAASSNNIAVCLLGEGKTAEAETWFEKTLLVDPNWTDAIFNLAALKLDRDEFDRARPFVDQLVQLLPNDSEVASLQARLRDSSRERLTLQMPGARSLESALTPAVKKLCDELAGNPRSIFISYAWPDSATKAFAARLARDLEANSFQVVLDQKHDLEVYEILVLLLHCQNVVVLNDRHYVESCLLGKVPVTATTSMYPSFAFPVAELESQEYLGEVFKISAVTWEMAKQMKNLTSSLPADFAFQVARPDSLKQAPGLRVFVEGWRVDEIQLVFANLRRYRSLSVAYLNGDNCLAGYPLFDFSSEKYYTTTFEVLLKILELGKQLTVDDAPIPFEKPDWSNYRWPESRIVNAQLWKIAEEDVGVWRPSITPSGEAGAVINRFKDWVPM